MRQNLTPLQRRTIGALLSYSSITSAAASVGISERTVHRWLLQPQFRAGLAAAENQTLEGVTRCLVHLTTLSLDVVAAILEDANAGPGVRLRAAQIVLDAVLRFTEMRSFEQRLAALEAVLHREEQ